ncbi:hypothetical protein [Caballeronia sp. LZ035]|uniref:hypothetical protein n=1 Tax=Caballeronia sp. LZ035 TaxID=3038568 RepID=UPI002866D3A7|nr:hypothetical protein [Caballeronia sp. LZ035]MDR5756319.1 hypothetical protein [Caballeronia sp. LZ035]
METRSRCLLFVGGPISYIDRVALSITAPLITEELGLDPAQLGIVFSSFSSGMRCSASSAAGRRTDTVRVSRSRCRCCGRSFAD